MSALRRFRLGITMAFAAMAAVASILLLAGRGAADEDPLVNRPNNTWTYVYSLGEKMRWYFRVRGQARMLITGDSRASSCDPMMFFEDTGENHNTPIAFSLYTGATGFDCHEIIFNEYFTHAPKLEWIVYQMSPRIFNTYYQDTGIEALNASVGLKWDRDNAEALWGYLPDKIITRADIPYRPATLSQRYRQIRFWPQFCNIMLTEAAKDIPGPHRRIWGRLSEDARRAIRETKDEASPAPQRIEPVYNGLNAIITGQLIYDEDDFRGLDFPDEAVALIQRRDELSDTDRQRLNRYLIEAAFPREIQKQHPLNVGWGWTEWRYGSANPNDIPQLIQLCSRGRFELNEDRWRRFLAILDYFEEHGVKMLVYVSPMHYGMARAACADDDGTLNSAYWAMMHRMEDLAAEHPNLFFIDLHKNGMNELGDADFFNWDHVNSFGAAKVTAILEDMRRAIDAQTKAELHRPRIAGATAVGDPGKLLINFSEPVTRESAADPARYSIEGAGVDAVTLSDDLRSALLATKPLAPGRNYSLRVNGIMGRSGLSLDGSPAAFSYARAFIAGRPSRAGYSWESLAPGMKAYSDADAVISSLPDGFEGLNVLRAADRDKGEGGDGFVSFDINYPTRIYIAHDERLQMKPSWLDQSQWRYSWDFINVTSPGQKEQQMRLLWRDFPAGTVRLGGNGGADGFMYLAIARPLNSTPAPR